MIYFVNIAEPYSGIYTVTNSYYDYFRNNSVPSKWINLHWDKNIRFDDMVEFKHIIGSGYSFNSIINYIRPSYSINDVKIYTDHRLMPALDGKEMMVIHDFFQQGTYIDRWKKKKVLKVLKSNDIGIITNSKFTASLCKKEQLRIISEFYPYYSDIYNSKVEKENLIISVGSNAARKRPDLILNFLNNLPSNWTFVRIGGDLSLLGKINTKAKYIYRNNVTREELISYYNNSKYLFIPSEEEGLGFPMIEALHHNVMVIANNKNQVLEEFNFPKLISKQKEGDFYIPEYPKNDDFGFFRDWYKLQIKNQFNIILNEISKISSL